MKTKRIEYIDLANVIATFAVVFLHANSCFWDFSKERYSNILILFDPSIDANKGTHA